MSFRVGEKVVCVAPGWNNNNQVKKFAAPKKHEVVEIVAIETMDGVYEKDVICLVLKGYPESNGYPARRFRKLDYDFVEQVIAQVTQIPVVIK